MKVSNLLVLAGALTPASAYWELFVTSRNGGVNGFATGAGGSKGCKRVSSSDARNYDIASEST